MEQAGQIGRGTTVRAPATHRPLPSELEQWYGGCTRYTVAERRHPLLGDPYITADLRYEYDVRDRDKERQTAR